MRPVFETISYSNIAYHDVKIKDTLSTIHTSSNGQYSSVYTYWELFRSRVQLDRSLVDPGSTQDRSRIDPRSIQIRNPVSIQGRSWIAFGSIQGRFGIDPGSIQGRTRVDPGSTQDFHTYFYLRTSKPKKGKKAIVSPIRTKGFSQYRNPDGLSCDPTPGTGHPVPVPRANASRSRCSPTGRTLDQASFRRHGREHVSRKGPSCIRSHFASRPEFRFTIRSVVYVMLKAHPETYKAYDHNMVT